MTNNDIDVKIALIETRLSNLEDKLNDTLVELKKDMNEIRTTMTSISNLILTQSWQKEELVKINNRIDLIDTKTSKYDLIIHQAQGAGKSMWVVWVIFGASIVSILQEIIKAL